ncbi:MAG: ribosomal-processing cysteine protease Prp [Spirochaetales bacterium]|nr:ribosomal-processing cysteine protease Prp [Spirochaetales bacterium]
MITCQVELSKERDWRHIVSLTSEGHFLAKKGTPSVACAAMSALIRTYGRQVESHGGLTAKITADKAGCFRAVIEGIDPDVNDWYSGICDFLLCGLGDLMRDYPNEFVMELKRR